MLLVFWWCCLYVDVDSSTLVLRRSTFLWCWIFSDLWLSDWYYVWNWDGWLWSNVAYTNLNSKYQTAFLTSKCSARDPISRPGLLTSFHLVFTVPSLGQHKFWVFDITLSGPAFPIVFVYYSINVKFVPLLLVVGPAFPKVFVCTNCLYIYSTPYLIGCVKLIWTRLVS